MKRWTNRVASACAVIIGALVAVCPAECGDTVASSSLKIGDWNFAVLIDTNSATPKVTGLVGLRDHSTSVSGNLQSVWYSRPAAGSGDPWVCKTWMNANHWTAIATVKGNLNIPNNLDNLWPTDDVNSPEVQIEEPQPYKDGFLVDDPWGQWLAGEPGREWVIDWLKNSGYPVADVPFDIAGPGDCTATSWLDTMAVAIEMDMASSNQAEMPGSMMLMTFASLCQACDAKIIATGAASAWSCTNPVAWSIVSYVDANGASKCRYSRSRTCTRTRTVTWQNADCSTQTLVQTDTMTEFEEFDKDPLPGGTCASVCYHLPCATGNNPNSIPFPTTPTRTIPAAGEPPNWRPARP